MSPPIASSARLAEVAEQLRAGTVDRVDLGGVVVRVAVVADDVAVLDDVVALAVVGGDRADAVQALGEVGEHVGDPVADAVVAALGGRAEPQRRDRQQRDDERERDQRQLDVRA